jgi:hypothetical protein
VRNDPADIGTSGSVGVTSKHRIKERAVEEVTRFLLIALYLWVVMMLFILQERIVLLHAHITETFTTYSFAVVIALVVAKVILIAEDLHFARAFEDRRLIYPILYKSVAFGILCMGSFVLEELLTGMWHGKPIPEALPPIARQGIHGVLLAIVILSVELIPLFALRELSRILGRDKMLALFFARRDTSPATPQ